MSTLVDLFYVGAARDPKRTAILFDDGGNKSKMTYEQLVDAIDVVSHKLMEMTTSHIPRYSCVGGIIGVILQSSLTMPVALLAVLKSGAAFYTLDASLLSATERALYIVNKLNIRCFLIHTQQLDTTDRLFSALHNLDRNDATFEHLYVTIITLSSRDKTCLSSPWSDSASNLDSGPQNCNNKMRPCVKGSDLAYVITTSGTTGLPKIVKVPHQCIVPNITHISKIYELSHTDLVFQASPLTFDPCIVEIFTCFYAGATLLCTTQLMKQQPRSLIDCLTRRNSVTVLQVTPSFLSHISRVESLSKSLLSRTSSLRILCLGGEPCPSAAVIRDWKEAGNQTVVINIYGITEVSSWATWHVITDQDIQSNRDVPLGRSLEGTTVELLNVDRDTGIGEIWLGGQARVCLIDEEEDLTPGRMRFTGDLGRKITMSSGFPGGYVTSGDSPSATTSSDSPGSGVTSSHSPSVMSQLYHVGRTDDVIKRNGKRINLMEINAIAARCTRVHKAVTIHSEDKLILLIQSSTIMEDLDVTDKERDVIESVQSMLRRWLPTYYAPDDIMLVHLMPLTKHGKVDKSRLLEIYTSSKPVRDDPSHELDREGVYSFVKELCKKFFMNVDSEPVFETYEKSTSTEMKIFETNQWHAFKWTEVGGDSLSAVRLVEEIERALGPKSIDLRLLLDRLLHETLFTVIDYINRQLHVAKANGICGLNEVKEVYEEQDKNPLAIISYDLTMLKEIKETIKCHKLIDSSMSKDEIMSTEIKRSMRDTQDATVRERCEDFRQSTAPEFVSNYIDINNSRADELCGKRKLSCSDELLNSIILRPSKKHMLLRDVGTDSHLQESSVSVKVSVSSKNDIDVDQSLVCDVPVMKDFFSEARNKKKVSDIHEACDTDMIKNVIQTSSRMSHDTDIIYSVQRAALRTDHASSLPSLMTTTDWTRLSTMSLTLRWSYNTGKCVDASPLVVIHRNGEGVVYIGSHSHSFSAISLDTGAIVWTVELSERIEGSACLSLSTDFIVVGDYSGKVYTLDRLTGAVMWTHQTGDQVKSSPRLTNHGLVCVGSHDQCLHLLDVEARSCKEIKLPGGGSVFSSPCVGELGAQGDVVVVGTLAGHLTAINTISYNVEWSCDVGKPLFSSAVTTLSGFCIGCVDGAVYCYGPSGTLVWKYQTSEPVFSSPCKAFVFCSGIPSVKDQRRPPIPSSVEDSSCPSSLGIIPISVKESSCPSSREIIPCEEFVIVGSHDRNVYCLSTTNGVLCWKTELDSPVYSSPFCFSLPPHHNESSSNRGRNSSGRNVRETCDYVTVCSTSGVLYVLDISTGKILARYSFPGPVFSSPVVVEDRLVVGCRDNNVYCIDISY